MNSIFIHNNRVTICDDIFTLFQPLPDNNISSKKINSSLLENQRNSFQSELNKEKRLRNILYILAGLFLFIIILVILGLKLSRTNNKILSEQKHKLLDVQEELRHKNEKIEKQKNAIIASYQDLQKAHDDLKDAQSKLIESEKLASLGMLTAGIAHEINNPINFVSANISPLKKDFEELESLLNKYIELHTYGIDNTKLKQIEDIQSQIQPELIFKEINNLMEGIAEGAARTKEIVLGLRNFARMDEEGFKLTDIHAGIDSTLVLLKSKMRHKVKVVKKYGQLPLIECIPGRLNQVFLNILDNAIHSIENNGEIVISTFDDGDCVRISIKDNGKGMDVKVLSRIFEPFYTTKKIGEGTGLGLSISYGIIENHGGKIKALSEPGKGSEFIITLPKNQKSI